MKINLDKTYLYGGKHYGPGTDVEVPDEAAKSIQERMKAGSPNAAPDAQLDSTAAGAQHPSDGTGNADAGALEGMTKAELLAEAEKRGVDANSSMTKADIIATIEAGK